MASVFVTVSILSVPKLRAHPNIMIGFISLFEGISCYHTVVWSINSMQFIEFFGLQNLMQYVFYIPPINSTRAACFTLCTFNRLIGSGFFSLMSLGMNICLCIDLYLTLKQPFNPAQRRLKFYVMGSVIFSASIILTMALYSAYNGGIEEMCRADTSTSAATLYNSILAICLSVYILIALFSVVYTGRMLSKPGISNNIKKLFLKKHILYVVGFITIWVITLSSAYRNLYKANTRNEDDERADLLLSSQGYKRIRTMLPNGVIGEIWYNEEEKTTYMDTSQVVSLMATISTGLIMAVIRCFEPYFIFICRRTFYMIYGKPWTIDDEQEAYGKLVDHQMMHVIFKQCHESFVFS